MFNLKKAKVKRTGRTIEVYESGQRATYIDFENCKTEYTYDEIELL